MSQIRGLVVASLDKVINNLKFKIKILMPAVDS
jgi:hypothetical protein